MGTVNLENNNQNSNFNWDKLSPAEFQQLQDLAAYTGNSVQRVIEHFSEEGKHAHYCTDGYIGFEGFKVFMDTYLEVDAPLDLCHHLFRSFVKKVEPPKPPPEPQLQPQPQLQQQQQQAAEAASSQTTIKGMAAVRSATATACAPITCHSASVHNVSTVGTHSTLTAKIHGLAAKLNPQEAFHTRNRAASVPASKIQSVTEALRPSTAEPSPCPSTPSRSPKQDLSCRLNEIDLLSLRIPLKDIVCYLSLIEGAKPEQKLEFMFRLYDTDGNGVLDRNETDCIVNQMMTVAEYLGWDVTELRPILIDMMVEIDYDADGTVSLEEWTRGGMTTIPLLVLLGLDTNFTDDGHHMWRLNHFSGPAYCNLCLNLLVGLGKKGLCCIVCKYTVHERCVHRAPASCISTYVKSRKSDQTPVHHWVEGNHPGKCFKCHKMIKTYNGINGLHCRWCKITLHNHCSSQVSPECDMGEHRLHILAPTSIFPAVLDRQTSYDPDKPFISSHKSGSTVDRQGALSFQIVAQPDTKPLVVFVNQKSGGRQGTRILRKFQYILNPRQVYNLADTNPVHVLSLFKDVPNLRVLCCGGDGTVGWVLDAMDKVDFLVQPCVGVIPLGTGNDLARCLRWGGGYEGESISKILRKIARAIPVMLDRWDFKLTEIPEKLIEELEEAARIGETTKIGDVTRLGGTTRKRGSTKKEGRTRKGGVVGEVGARNGVVEEGAVIEVRAVVEGRIGVGAEGEGAVGGIGVGAEEEGAVGGIGVGAGEEGAVGGIGVGAEEEGAVGGIGVEEGAVEGIGVGAEEEGTVGGIGVVEEVGAVGGIGLVEEGEAVGQERKGERKREEEEEEEEEEEDEKKPCWPGPTPFGIINNYFSVGVDAAICVKFHMEREKNPHKFSSRMKNKLWYFEFATTEHFAATCKNLHENIEVSCDGISLNLASGPSLQGIAVLNIPYTHGGSNLWGENSHKRKKRKGSEESNGPDLDTACQDIGDQLIEVIGLENCLHMGQVRTGLRASGRRLAQGSRVDIRTRKTFPMQIDGEPWMQPPSIIEITHKNQVPLLMAPAPDKVSTFMAILRSLTCTSAPTSNNVSWINN